MRQILHIVRKDLRHLWIEVAAFAAVLAAYTAMEVSALSRPRAAASGLLPMLVEIALAVLTIRVVQAERLAGLHQFWTTRPYAWPQLLAAKALFLLLTVFLPLVVSQMYLLHRAGLGVAQNMASLEVNLLLVTAVMVLPVAGVAALTRSFAEAALGVLGGLVFLAVFAYLQNARYRMSADGLLGWQVGIVGVVLFAVLLVQYSRRATRQALAILAAAPGLVLLTILLCAGGPLADVGYAAPSETSGIAIRIDDSHMTHFGGSPAVAGEPTLRLPLIVSTPTGTSAATEGERLTLTGADGYRWRSAWLPGGILARGDAAPGVSSTAFPVPQGVLDRLGSGATRVRIEFLVEQMQDLPAQTYALTGSVLAVPGLGMCGDRWSSGNHGVVCRTAFVAPQNLTVDVGGEGDRCSDAIRSATLGATRSVAISPIVETSLYSFPQEFPREDAGCRSTSITYTQRRSVRRVMVAMPEVTMGLKEYLDDGR